MQFTKTSYICPMLFTKTSYIFVLFYLQKCPIFVLFYIQKDPIFVLFLEEKNPYFPIFPQYKRNIIESGIKHHNPTPNPILVLKFWQFIVLSYCTATYMVWDFFIKVTFSCKTLLVEYRAISLSGCPGNTSYSIITTTALTDWLFANLWKSSSKLSRDIKFWNQKNRWSSEIRFLMQSPHISTPNYGLQE